MTEVLIVKTKDTKSDVKHKIGNYYILTDKCGDTHLCVLAQTGVLSCALIDLSQDCNRWSEPVDVNNVFDISEEELKTICGDGCSLKLLNKVKITIE